MPTQPIPLRLSPGAATRAINLKARDSGNVILTHHALQRMEQRGITFAEVLTILRKGSVTTNPSRLTGNDWEALIEWRMPGGRDAAVATVVRTGDRLVVKTVMWKDRR